MRVLLFIIAFISFVFSWFMMAWAFEEANGGSYYGTNTSTDGHNPTLALILFFVAMLVSFICIWIPARMQRD